MIKYVLKQNNNEKSKAFGKYYAYPVVEETMDLEALARHMEEHNTGFSEAMCVGVMKAMVKCIKEQLLNGKNVKIDNLAIFSVGIRNKEGAQIAEEFTVANNIAGVKLRARATGTLSNANLNLAASLRKASTLMGNGGGNGGSTNSGSTDNGDTPTPPPSGGTPKFTLTVKANNDQYGTVEGGGEYAENASATLKAIAKSGYEFKQWNDGNTAATRVVTVVADKTYTATFSLKQSEEEGTI